MTENSSTAEAVQTPSPEVSTQPQQTAAPAAQGFTPETQSAATTDGVQTPTGAPVVPPAYQPNYKFKVLDKDQEIDPMFRQLIKDAETEKKIREMHEKAFGLPIVKENLNKEKLARKEFETKYTQIDKSLNLLSKFVQNDDFDSFFDKLKIPEAKVLNWVERKLKEMELPPEERARSSTQREQMQRAYALEQENQELRQRQQQSESQAMDYEINQTLEKPDVQNIVSEFDTKMGYQGAFRDEVIKVGQYHWAVNKRHVPVQEAVQEVANMIGKFVGSPQGLQQSVTPEQSAGGRQAPPPVIPNVTGRSVSPVKKSPRSIDDLRSLAKNF